MNSRMRICHSYPKRTLSLLLGRNKHHIRSRAFQSAARSYLGDVSRDQPLARSLRLRMHLTDARPLNHQSGHQQQYPLLHFAMVPFIRSTFISLSLR